MNNETGHEAKGAGICSHCGNFFSSCQCSVDELEDKEVETRSQFFLDKIRKNVKSVKELGKWPAWVDEDSMLERMPSSDKKDAKGFDAGVALALGMIPERKNADGEQDLDSPARLIATLHANYSGEAIKQILKDTADLKNLDPESATCWWLAASSLCKEGSIGQREFLKQIKDFEQLRSNSEERKKAGQKEFENMASSFELKNVGGVDNVAIGEKDGCIQGAYVKGYRLGVSHDKDSSGLYFVGTYLPTLGLEEFHWESGVDKEKRPTSGPVHGSIQYVKCANYAELERVIQWISEKNPDMFKKAQLAEQKK